MQSLKMTTSILVTWVILCSVACAEQVLSVRIDNGEARMTVSEGTSFAFAKAMADALRTLDINDVALNITADGISVLNNGQSKQWVYVIVDDNDQTKNEVFVCVSPDTPFTFASAFADALTAVCNQPVKFISKEGLDSHFRKL